MLLNKEADRTILHSFYDICSRAAEIIFSMANTVSRRKKHKNFPGSLFMDKLIQARRHLGLFQHHDGITGTAKDFVVVDYGNR